ncbi:MAG: CDP-alcohol phosphatidyltransferase family protein [Nitriliruptoraceae bacterium]|nr:CDP-alcohol phosphatidyltransferase family protein [Nitriliruptoraceae bacterium]
MIPAFVAAPDGRAACLLGADDRTVISELLGDLQGLAPSDHRLILTRPEWEEPVRAELRRVGPGAAELRVVADVGDLLEVWGELAAGRIVVVPGETIALPLALGRIADAAAQRTGALVASPSSANVQGGRPARTVRGRLVASASHLHPVARPTNLTLDAFVVAAGDREGLERALGLIRRELADDRIERADVGTGLALLLVALIRSGVPVAAIASPPEAPWAAIGSEEEVFAARRARDAVDEERVRLNAAVKEEDGFFSTFLVSTYSRYVARAAARVGATPNQVTCASMALAVLASAAYAVGTVWWAVLGGLLLQVAFMLDCVDGQLSRYTRNFSIFGAWLDSVFDRGKEYLVYVGLAVGGIRAGQDPMWLLASATLLLQTFRHTLDLGYAEQQRVDVAREVVRPLLDDDPGAATFWEPAGDGTDPALAQRGLQALRSAEAVPPLKWAKRIVVLPIGERFALISVVAVVAGPRMVFLALLTWGALAAAYTFGGRLVRSLV